MKPIAIITAALALSTTAANAATVYLGGRFHPGFTVGYIDAIDGRDTSGDVLGETINFSHTPIFPGPVTVSLDTPDYGWESFTFTTLATFTANAAGEFWQLTDANHDAFSVNLVNFGYGIPSFGLFANFAPPLPPAPSVIPEPPPCVICDAPPPPPPCVVCGPTPIIAVPETSTWLMGLIGFACLGFSVFRQRLATVSQWRRG